jgi:hypothetical protein
VPDDLPTEESPEGREVHPGRHGGDLRQRHGVRHAVYTYEDPKRWRPLTSPVIRVPTGRVATYSSIAIPDQAPNSAAAK